MKTILLSYFFILLISCENKKPYSKFEVNNKFHLPNTPIFLSKTYAVKSVDSFNLASVQNLSDSELNSSRYFFLIRSDTAIYYRKVMLVFDTTIKIKAVYEYESELTKFVEFKKTSREFMYNTIVGNLHITPTNSIKIDTEAMVIIDNSDTLAIFSHWPKEKFIFVDDQKVTYPMDRKIAFSKFNTIIYSYK
jgi:hypothetical protein